MAKITRQTLGIFGNAGASTNFAKFGSQAAGSAVQTKTIATIQALAAYANGWQDAVALGNAPYLEDMNALFYLHSYQQCYALQEGTPEWDSGTTYFIGSLVKRTGTSELYMSLVDTNLNNVLPTAGASNASWQFVSGIIGGVFRVGGALAMNSLKVTGLAAATAAGDALRFEQMKVIQIVGASTASVFATTSASYQNTNLAATITPSSTSNKILVLVSGGLEKTGPADYSVRASVSRGATEVTGGGTLCAIRTGDSVGNFRVPASFFWLDAPATVSATIYTVVVSSDGTNTTRFPTNSGETASILLAEVVA